jgi:thiamine-monophosphate kinase
MTEPADSVLSDYGERRLISELLARRYAGVGAFGDDAAALPHGRLSDADTLLVTTDPCPEPAAHIAGFPDEYYRGWLVVTINLSDLAAAGARPLGLVTSLVLPSSTTTKDFERLLDGIDACCAQANTTVVGGNLKEGSKLDVSATAIGYCQGSPMSRRGSSPGDCLAVVGDLGLFWAGLELVRRGVQLPAEHRDELLRNVLTPTPQLRAGQALLDSGVITSCMDNSDGLYSSLETFRLMNGVGFELDFSQVSWHPAVEWAANEMGIDPVRFALGWGDWQLLVTFKDSDMETVERAAEVAGSGLTVIGLVAEDQRILIDADGTQGQLAPIDSQRFAKDSWFSIGLQAYEDRLFRRPIVE